jgi:hypothetical protein
MWRVRLWSRMTYQNGSNLGANTPAGACTGQAVAVTTRRRKPACPLRPLKGKRVGGKAATAGISTQDIFRVLTHRQEIVLNIVEDGWCSWATLTGVACGFPSVSHHPKCKICFMSHLVKSQ